MQHAGRWDEAAAALIGATQRLERGGADFVVICTHTTHRMADEVQAAIGLPLLHIADPTAGRITAAGFKTVGLLGTAFTMEQAFYKGRLAERHGLEVLVPEEGDRALVHRVIYEELVQGRVEPMSQVTDCRDPRDTMYLELAEAAGASTIVWSDNDLLVLHPWRGVDVSSPASYLARAASGERF